MNYKTRCTAVYLNLQKILTSTVLPMSLISCILSFVLVEVGTRLYTQSHTPGIICDIQFDDSDNIAYHIAYVPYQRWDKCLGKCNWDRIRNHPARLLFVTNQLWFDSMPYFREQWYPIPQTECADNLVKKCIQCCIMLCELCFLQSKQLMGTVGDVNPLFDETSYSLFWSNSPPRLIYYPEEFVGFGYSRICLYCENIRQYSGKSHAHLSQAKAQWRDLMMQVGKKNMQTR